VLHVFWKGISSPLSKLGKKDLFSPTLDRAHSQASRPASLSPNGEVEKVMVMLTPRQVHALDRICLEIRQTSGMKVKRSMLLRALVDGFLERQINYKDAKSLADINQRIIHAVSSRS
jgi:hypothetical protein